MNGEQSLTIEEKINKLDKVLDNFEISIKLPHVKLSNEIENLFNMDRGQLEALTTDQCGEGAYLLAKYSFELQRLINRETAKINWVDSNVRIMLVSQLSSFDKYCSFEERKLLALKQNDAAMKMETIKVQAKSRSDRLSYLTHKIDYIAKTLLELQQTKRNKEQRYD